MSDDWDYSKELDDEVDTLQFGKYKGLTPVEVLNRDPGYITWAVKSAPTFWVGSEKIIKLALRIVPTQAEHAKEVAYRNRPKPRDISVAAFEEAMYKEFGEYPVTSKGNYNIRSHT